jgi:putative endonuclease
MFFTYILKSQTHKTHYYGHTNDVYRRLDEHNKGFVRYTSGRRPWIVHYFEEFNKRSEAAKREHFFKSIEGYKYLKENKII